MTEAKPVVLTDLDKKLINLLQDGFPLTARPFETVAQQISAAGFEASEAEVIARIQALLD